MAKYEITYLILHITKQWTEEKEIIDYDRTHPYDIQDFLPFLNLDQYEDFEHGYILCSQLVPDTLHVPVSLDEGIDVTLDFGICIHIIVPEKYEDTEEAYRSETDKEDFCTEDYAEWLFNRGSFMDDGLRAKRVAKYVLKNGVGFIECASSWES